MLVGQELLFVVIDFKKYWSGVRHLYLPSNSALGLVLIQIKFLDATFSSRVFGRLAMLLSAKDKPLAVTSAVLIDSPFIL